MTTFWLACAGLVLFSGLFYLFPGSALRRPLDDRARANLEWYRLRRRELAEDDDTGLETDAQLRLLEDDQRQLEAAPSHAASTRFPVWLLLPVMAVAAGGLYYQLGAAPDVRIAERLQALDDSTDDTTMLALMDAISARAAQRPDNLHYLALLGRFHMGQGDYDQAAETYRLLAAQAPEDAQALAYAAQANYLAAGRELDPESQALAEQSLSINPHQRTALGLLGMAAFERGQYRAAIGYWERLLAMEDGDSEGARMIAGVIDQARERLGEPVATAQHDSSAELPLGLSLRVLAPEGASLNPADTVFVLARSAASDSRMPIAVQRLRADQLPATLRLDDSNSMAGQKLSEADEVVVVVQVSPDGSPGEANASWLGRAGPLRPSADGEPLEITLAPRPG
ncbi:c-type cytochrome biogenesis protein CcmI [Kineobactrum salinum]|uniref:C-type cytochrome biogenesis protein CcmI n=1 Tax=Kineobactrum salinum TaxID=2708301 RepID=A0A6C0TXZ3_9GAMM|nr:c-type cytochrome biogenesis protein CcmI [Kineobactrum salinum]QIB64403.1 c-type cytochrome biogenesis protein CcmI [Kineobactrum salinum]